MAEPEKEREQFSGMFNGFSRDLLQRFINGSDFRKRAREESNNVEEELELTLGLSLNGKFGVDPERAKTSEITRSLSVSLFMPGGAESQARVFPNATYAPLTRTCSLPVETQEEWWKRKELQSLRRLEARKRRMEKLKFSRAERDRVDSEENSCEENGSNIDSIGQDSVNNYANGNSNGMPSSQGSIGSQGSGSSGLSEFDSQPTQVKQNNEAGSPSKMFCQALQSGQKQVKSAPSPTKESTIFSGPDKGEKETKNMVKNVMLDMPCVSTIGNGPSGRKVDGFLYRYGKGEEVSIVCVCHGSFLSPAEFVKHAGGTEVEHPLRHIVVNSSSLL